MDIKTLGIDLAKNIFQLHGVNAADRIELKKTIRHSNLLPSYRGMKLLWKRVAAQIIGPENLKYMAMKSN